MYLKIHKDKYSEVVAICDEDLVGKTLEEGNLVINISERFYKGDKVNEEEASKILKTALNVNAVGEESVQVCIKLSLVDEKNVLKIKGVPYAQIITT
ncbi:DUF424 family protein [Candidatus Woesearchaeota archaeon]|nr:DUF424 family protein [Candidatus Woesearchaeota archaeon]